MIRKLWKEENREVFAECLEGLERDKTVMQMRDNFQHAKGYSCYDHCIFVAYMGFTMCRALGLDYRAAARAGLLHDLYLANWHDTSVGNFKRLWVHPHIALDNASQRIDLSEKEADIIVKHMWPLTAPLPAYRESWLVSLADKVCACIEMTHLTRPLNIKNNIIALTVSAG
ncbi:MAG: HDIG domain-containing protein [Clostridia bacterium]|nr:HDIG domain-containing protein [Clostridia bacterium]NLS86146.1 HDIG domain-containing protein [Oscillospiraceae bacterium]